MRRLLPALTIGLGLAAATLAPTKKAEAILIPGEGALGSIWTVPAQPGNDTVNAQAPIERIQSRLASCVDFDVERSGALFGQGGISLHAAANDPNTEACIQGQLHDVHEMAEKSLGCHIKADRPHKHEPEIMTVKIDC